MSAAPPTQSTEPPLAPADFAGTSSQRGRPSWSGLLRLSLLAVPIKAYPVHNSSASIPFHQLHADCGQRIRYHKHCPLHGPIDAADIARGYEYAPEQHVVVAPEELDQVRPAKDKALLLEQFLPRQHIDPALFAGRSLYLLPDGIAARHPYGVVAEALQRQDKWALGRVVLSSHRQLVLVRPWSRLLVLDVLHYPAEIRPAPAWQTEPCGSTAIAEESRLVDLLIDAASTPVDWSKYRDVNAEELLALVEAKVAGRPLAAPTQEPLAMLHLLDALKQSVAAAQQPSAASKASSRKNPLPRKANP